MKIDADRSAYQERSEAFEDFDRSELRSLRVLLRRLRFLEHQLIEIGGVTDDNSSGGAAYAELEIEALEFVLSEMGFLEVSANHKESA